MRSCPRRKKAGGAVGWDRGLERMLLSRFALLPLWEVAQLGLFCGVCNYIDRGCVVFEVNRILGTARPGTLLMA